MTPIPAHLAQRDWYAPHQAYLRSIGVTPRHDPGDAKPVCADLRGADLRGADLSYADLRSADLTDADLTDANLTDANLSRADLSFNLLRGADLRDANLTGADLSCAYLRRADLRDADLRRADLRDADLTDADLSGANLRDADLSGANLRDADLSDADLIGARLRGAVGLPAAPVIPDIDAAILAAVESDGCSLDMSDWHTCGTTHCRAGWAIYLAGEAGAALEAAYGPSVAGALIYTASRPGQPVPDWHATDDDALADLRRCAGGAE